MSDETTLAHCVWWEKEVKLMGSDVGNDQWKPTQVHIFFLFSQAQKRKKKLTLFVLTFLILFFLFEYWFWFHFMSAKILESDI